jgi:hypothetical protein
VSFLWLQNMYWTGLGLLVGYIWWRLPDHLQVAKARIQAWRETLPWNAREIARIECAFVPGHYTPIEEPKLYLLERVRQYFSDLEESTRPRPRTPEQVAEAAYRKALHANENPSSSRLLR